MRSARSWSTGDPVDPSPFAVLAAEVDGFEPSTWMEPAAPSGRPLAHIHLAAARLAIADPRAQLHRRHRTGSAR